MIETTLEFSVGRAADGAMPFLEAHEGLGTRSQRRTYKDIILKSHKRYSEGVRDGTHLQWGCAVVRAWVIGELARFLHDSLYR